MATVLFSPMRNVANLPLVEAVEVRHAEVADIIKVVSLLEDVLVDFSAFAEQVAPTVKSVMGNFSDHAETIRNLPSLDKRNVNPIITSMTMDIQELRAAVCNAAAQDGQK